MADLIGLMAMVILGTPMMVGLTIARNAYHNRKLKELNARKQRLYSRRVRPARRALTVAELLNGEVS